MKYFARVSIRDGKNTIAACIESIASQTVKPEKIIVVNDGSSDGTGEILQECMARYGDLLHVINTGSRTRDYSRLPRLLNLSLIHACRLGLDCDYFFSTGGDCRFAPDYVEKLMVAMAEDPTLVLASGDYGTRQASAPHGAGRLIRMSWFNDSYPRGFPEILGYESEILMRIGMQGLKYAVVKDAVFDHMDKLGHAHSFKEWGQGMHTLGYDPLYVLLKFIDDFRHNRAIGRRGALKILYHYVVFRPKKTGYYSRFGKDLRMWIRTRQREMMAAERDRIINNYESKVYHLIFDHV